MDFLLLPMYRGRGAKKKLTLHQKENTFASTKRFASKEISLHQEKYVQKGGKEGSREWRTEGMKKGSREGMKEGMNEWRTEPRKQGRKMLYLQAIVQVSDTASSWKEGRKGKQGGILPSDSHSISSSLDF